MIPGEIEEVDDSVGAPARSRSAKPRKARGRGTSRPVLREMVDEFSGSRPGAGDQGDRTLGLAGRPRLAPTHQAADDPRRAERPVLALADEVEDLVHERMPAELGRDILAPAPTCVPSSANRRR